MNAPARYTKRPVTIEAMQWTEGGEVSELREFTNNLIEVSHDPVEFEVYDRLHDTWVKFAYTDWIIKGVKGEFYPCADDVFQATYMPHEDAQEEGRTCSPGCEVCGEVKKAEKGLTINVHPDDGGATGDRVQQVVIYPRQYGKSEALAEAVRRGTFDPYRQRS